MTLYIIKMAMVIMMIMMVMLMMMMMRMMMMLIMMMMMMMMMISPSAALWASSFHSFEWESVVRALFSPERKI